MTVNDHMFKMNLTMSRLHIGMSYLNVHFLEALIQQLIQVYVQKIDPIE